MTEAHAPVSDEVDDLEVVIRNSLEEGAVDWKTLLRLSDWRASDDKRKCRMADRYYLQVLEAFKQQGDEGDADVAVFPGIGGVYLRANGRLQASVYKSQISFDWGSAPDLLMRLESLADQVRDWWRPQEDPTRTEPVPDEADGFFARATRRRRRRRLWQAQTERRPHSGRAYGAITWALSALGEEQKRHDPALNVPDAPSASFERDLDHLQAMANRSERLFQIAAQRGAQVRYGRGMLRGAIAMAVLTGIVGWQLSLHDVPAAWAVGLPAGAIGAVVSVLNRMTSGRLKLDIQATRELLLFIGAFRPVVGAVFGMVLTALLEGGFLPALQAPPHRALPFYAVLGFLAGFNERFAQDMLVGSAKRITGLNDSGAESATGAGESQR